MLVPASVHSAMTQLCSQPCAAEDRWRAEGKQQPTCMGMTLKSFISCSVSDAASCGWEAAAALTTWPVPRCTCCCLASINKCMSLWHCCIL